MDISGFMWSVVLYISIGMLFVSSSHVPSFEGDFDYLDLSPEEDDSIGPRTIERPKKFFLSPNTISESSLQTNLNECITPIPGSDAAPAPEEATVISVGPHETPQQAVPPSNALNSEDSEIKARELRNLVQHLYIAQARVQLEATEIKKAQAVANSAQQALEEAANHVRTITAALQNSQQEVASAAIRAQTAQLQLAAHDQLLFAARQDVDALSSQMVGLQAAEGISQPRITVDLTGLLEKLKQPLPESEKPTPVQPIVPVPTFSKEKEKIITMQQQLQQPIIQQHLTQQQAIQQQALQQRTMQQQAMQQQLQLQQQPATQQQQQVQPQPQQVQPQTQQHLNPGFQNIYLN